MCLLDRVESWSATEILCRATTHQDPHHPLRMHARLGAVCGLEYAAQAMALHARLGAVSGEQPPPGPGYLASVRELNLEVARLDDIGSPLEVGAQRISGDERLLVYSFALRADGRLLVHGRASVVLMIRSEAGL